MKYNYYDLQYAIDNGIDIDKDTNYWDTFDDEYDKVNENGLLVLYDKNNKILDGIVYGGFIDKPISYYSCYKNGVLDGEEVHFYESGEVMTYGIYKNGVLDGEFAAFNKDGSYQIRYFSKKLFPLVIAVYDSFGIEHVVFRRQGLELEATSTFDECVKKCINKEISELTCCGFIFDDCYEYIGNTLKCIMEQQPEKSKFINKNLCGWDKYSLGQLRDKAPENGGKRMNGFLYETNVHNPTEIRRIINGYSTGECIEYNTLSPGKMSTFRILKNNYHNGIYISFSSEGNIDEIKYYVFNVDIFSCDFDDNGNYSVRYRYDSDCKSIEQYVKEITKLKKQEDSTLDIYSEQIILNAKEEQSNNDIYYPV